MYSYLLNNINIKLSLVNQSAKRSQHQEAFFAQLLPVLFEGFKSDCIVYKQSSYLICSFLFEKFKFNNETSNRTLFAISKGLSTFRYNKKNNGADEDDENLMHVDVSDDIVNILLDDESMDCVKSAILAICLIVQSQQSNNKVTNDMLLMNKNFIKKLIKNFQVFDSIQIFHFCF